MVLPKYFYFKGGTLQVPKFPCLKVNTFPELQVTHMGPTALFNLQGGGGVGLYNIIIYTAITLYSRSLVPRWTSLALIWIKPFYTIESTNNLLFILSNDTFINAWHKLNILLQTQQELINRVGFAHKTLFTSISVKFIYAKKYITVR